MTQEELLIKKDRMRFIKNKLPANLAILCVLPERLPLPQEGEHAHAGADVCHVCHCGVL